MTQIDTLNQLFTTFLPSLCKQHHNNQVHDYAREFIPMILVGNKADCCENILDMHSCVAKHVQVATTLPEEFKATVQQYALANMTLPSASAIALLLEKIRPSIPTLEMASKVPLTEPCNYMATHAIKMLEQVIKDESERAYNVAICDGNIAVS